MLPALCNGDAPYAFLDYCLCDAQAVDGIAQELDRRGVPLWHDEGLGYDTLFQEEVARRIAGCGVFLLFLSEKALQQRLFRAAFHYAMDKKCAVVPVFLEDVELPASFRLLFHSCGADNRAVSAQAPDFYDRLYAIILPLIQ